MANFGYEHAGGTHILTSRGGVQMVMLVRTRRERFTDFVAREAAAQKLTVVVNGSYIKLPTFSNLSTWIRSSPLDAADSTPTGQVVQRGAVLGGESSTDKFHFSQNTCGVGHFSADIGNPPATSCAALGGIAPIIVDKLPYGAVNLYKPGVPPDAPLEGPVPPNFQP